MTAFEYMDYQQKISYYGVDKNRYWEKIHNFIEADFDSGRTKFARDINVLTYFDENRIKRCNVIIIQYCYANYSANIVEKNFGMHNPKSPLLFGEIDSTDVIKERKVKSPINNQMSLFDI